MNVAPPSARLGWEQLIPGKPSKFISVAGNSYSAKRNNDIKKSVKV
jgi:hypothetical protein